jgi:hypothetical protein
MLQSGLVSGGIPQPSLEEFSDAVYRFKRARLLAQLELGLRKTPIPVDVPKFTKCELLVDEVSNNIANRLACDYDNGSGVPTNLRERIARGIVGGIKQYLLEIPAVGVERALLKLNLNGVDLNLGSVDTYEALLVVKKQFDSVRVAIMESQKVDFYQTIARKIYEKQEKYQENQKKTFVCEENIRKEKENIRCEFLLSCCMCNETVEFCRCGTKVTSQSGLGDLISSALGNGGGGSNVSEILNQLEILNNNFTGLEKNVKLIIAAALFITSVWAIVKFVEIGAKNKLLNVVKALVLGLTVFGAVFASGHYMHKALASMNEHVSDVVTSQAIGVLDMKPICGMLVASAGIMQAVPVTGMKRMDVLLKGCENFTRRAEGLDAVRVWLVDLFERIINLVRVQVLGKAPICLQTFTNSECSSWIDRALEIMKLAAAEKFPITVANAEKLGVMILEGKELQANMVKKGSTGATSGFNQFSKLLSYLIEIEAPFKRACCTMSGLRVRPTIVLLSGAPGVGKTQIALPLICKVGPSIIKPEEHEEFKRDYMHYVYVRNAETKFWDGYAPHKIFMVIDDFMQAKDVAGNPDNEIMDLIRCGSAFPNMLHMADLSSKGNMMFRSQIILCTSNAIDFKPNSIVEPEALNRRFDIMVKVVPKKEFCTPSTKNADLDKRRLDPLSPNGVCDTSMMEFHVMHYVDGKITFKELVDYDELCKMIVSLGRKRQLEHEEYMGRTAQEIEAGIVMSQGLWSRFKNRTKDRADDAKIRKEMVKNNVYLLQRVGTRFNHDFISSYAQIEYYLASTMGQGKLGELVMLLTEGDSNDTEKFAAVVAIDEAAAKVTPKRILDPTRMRSIMNSVNDFSNALRDWAFIDGGLKKTLGWLVGIISAVGMGALFYKMFIKDKKLVPTVAMSAEWTRQEKINVLTSVSKGTIFINKSGQPLLGFEACSENVLDEMLAALQFYDVIDEFGYKRGDLADGVYVKGNVTFVVWERQQNTNVAKVKVSKHLVDVEFCDKSHKVLFSEDPMQFQNLLTYNPKQPIKEHFL